MGLNRRRRDKLADCAPLAREWWAERVEHHVPFYRDPENDQCVESLTPLGGEPDLAVAAVDRGCGKGRRVADRKRRRRERDRCRVRDPAKAAKPADLEKIQRHIENARSTRELVRHRFEYGCVVSIDPPVREQGLRTWILPTPSLKRFVQILPKKVECGRTKGPSWIADAKVLGCDEPYVYLDRRRMGAVVIDIDRIFDVEDLKRQLAELLPPDASGKRPLPNIISGTRRDDRIHRPHLIWLLPPGAEVWEDNPITRALLKRVHRGLIEKLIPIGADPAQTANFYKLKNPLSPHRSAIIIHDRFRRLGELAPLVRLDVGLDELERAAAALRGVFNSGESQGLWNGVGRLIRAALKDGRRDGEFIAALGDSAKIYRWLVKRVRDCVCEKFGADDKVHAVIETRCDFWSRTIGGRRGRDNDSLAHLKATGQYSAAAAHSLAARTTNTGRRSDTVDLTLPAMRRIAAAGGDPFHRHAVVRECAGTPSRSAIYDNWAAAERAFRAELAAAEADAVTTAGDRANNFRAAAMEEGWPPAAPGAPAPNVDLDLPGTPTDSQTGSRPRANPEGSEWQRRAASAAATGNRQKDNPTLGQQPHEGAQPRSGAGSRDRQKLRPALEPCQRSRDDAQPTDGVDCADRRTASGTTASALPPQSGAGGLSSTPARSGETGSTRSGRHRVDGGSPNGSSWRFAGRSRSARSRAADSPQPVSALGGEAFHGPRNPLDLHEAYAPGDRSCGPSAPERASDKPTSR
jgi:hypothetical protein